MTACNAISPSPFSDIFEDDFINAVIDDELTQYGETSGKDSNDYTQNFYCIFMYKYVIPKKEQNVLHSTYKFSVTM